MRLLPILWAEPPTPEDWARLSAAREAAGYTEKIQPAEAFEGSPQPILAIGKRPSWVTDYAMVESTLDSGLAEQLAYCLEGSHDDNGDLIAGLLSEWMGAEVTYAGEEPHEQPVGFRT